MPNPKGRPQWHARMTRGKTCKRGHDEWFNCNGRWLCSPCQTARNAAYTAVRHRKVDELLADHGRNFPKRITTDAEITAMMNLQEILHGPGVHVRRAFTPPALRVEASPEERAEFIERRRQAILRGCHNRRQRLKGERDGR